MDYILPVLNAFEGLDRMLRIFIIFGCMVVVTATVASDHPCKRPCVSNKPLICEYNFTVENYFILSRACWNCPFNYTDCFRPHCVSADGLMRQILTVNRQFPGPSIEVCQGDTVRVWVANKMDDGSATTIHWHGLRQFNSNMMDGVPRLTQCNIPPFEIFRYEFTVRNPGTHWWHSHTALQLGEGLIGAFIVREPDERVSQRSLYDEDSSDHIVVINGWPDKPQIFHFMEEMHHRWVHRKDIKVLVNGRGRKHLVKDAVIAGGTNSSACTPYETFTVSAGQKYRFRVIAAAARCFYRVMIEDHVMTVIAGDGVPMKPTTVGSFIIHPGERYDFVLHANQKPDDYWIKVQGLGDCDVGDDDGDGAAILHYHAYQGSLDFIPKRDLQDVTNSGMLLNPTTDLLSSNNTLILQDSLRYDPPGDVDENYTDEVVDIKYYISLRYQDNDNSYYSHPVYYPQGTRETLSTPTLNNISMAQIPFPLATEWDDRAETYFCNSSTVNTETDCTRDLCLCVHMLDIKLGQVVELFMASQSSLHLTEPHQMHMHGYTFRVVGQGYFSDNVNYTTVSLNTIMERDAAGEYKRNLVNPLYKDTVTVQSNGGYAIIRFKADNPGIWFFHCHNEGHLLQGMSMLLKVGQPEQFPKVPDYFPTCGGYSQYLKNQRQAVSGATQNVMIIALMVGMVVIETYLF